MSIHDSSQLPPDSEIRADICIVGAGAAGLTLGRMLNNRGLSVVILEAGGLERDPSVEKEAFAFDEVGEPLANPMPQHAHWFGGATNLWFGRIAAPAPIDFEARSWVPYSGWPITFDEIRPWLQVAARLLNVRHFDKVYAQNWPLNETIETFIHRGGANLEVFLWAQKLRMGQQERAFFDACRDVRVMLNATAIELTQSGVSSAVDSLTVCTGRGRRFSVKASTYVLAGGGLENPRLLLASAGRSPEGTGNAYDQVGRYFMDHPRGEGSAEVSLAGLSRSQLQSLLLLGEKVATDYGEVQFRVTFPEQMQRDEALLNHSLHSYIISDYHESPGFHDARSLLRRLMGKSQAGETSMVKALAGTMRHSPSLLALGGRLLAGRTTPTRLLVVDQMEQEPDPESRVRLKHGTRDRFGLPRLEVDWRIGDSTYRSQRRMHQLFQDVLQSAGIKTFRSDLLRPDAERPRLIDMRHPMGTTRMAASPRYGVVDADLRVHGLENLYVVGSSVFPTGGHANPTLLLVALAARLADRLQRIASRQLHVMDDAVDAMA